MPNRRALSSEQELKVVEMYAAHANATEIARHFGCSRAAIENALIRRGVQRRKARKQARLTSLKRYGDRKDRIKSWITVNEMTDCWEVRLSLVGKNGYAKIRYLGEQFWAHRFAYESYKGAIPAGMDVCHTCDNRRCINPKHLFTGTRLDNMRDCKSKDRISRGVRHGMHLRGERGPSAKLTWGKVRSIREALNDGTRPEMLASKYSVSIDTIRLIRSGKTWSEGILT
jgi:uncharacterized protein (DUF433 family)